jgi:hypothetical protein
MPVQTRSRNRLKSSVNKVKHTRKCPKKGAKEFKIGIVKKGLDGNYWKVSTTKKRVSTTKKRVKRWKKLNTEQKKAYLAKQKQDKLREKQDAEFEQALQRDKEKQALQRAKEKQALKRDKEKQKLKQLHKEQKKLRDENNKLRAKKCTKSQRPKIGKRLEAIRVRLRQIRIEIDDIQ